MGIDAAEPAAQSKQHSNKRHFVVEIEYRQEVIRSVIMRNMFRYSEPERTATQEGL